MSSANQESKYERSYIPPKKWRKITRNKVKQGFCNSDADPFILIWICTRILLWIRLQIEKITSLDFFFQLKNELCTVNYWYFSLLSICLCLWVEFGLPGLEGGGAAVDEGAPGFIVEEADQHHRHVVAAQTSNLAVRRQTSATYIKYKHCCWSFPAWIWHNMKC